MEKATRIIETVAEETSKAILFHSGSGKDSIALLDLMSSHFEEIVCVYMYIVKDLSHIGRFINYSRAKYPNARFVQAPHYVLGTYKSDGYMGCEINPNAKKSSLMSINEMVRQKYGIDWTFYGFKQSDSMNRRLMLRTYEANAINRDQRKCYPLSEYKNRDIIDYIHRRGLIMPETYGKSQSSGTNISDINYLLFLRQRYPQDLKRVIAEYPLVQRVLFEYDYNEV